MLTPGQDYSAKFLTSKGFKLISSPIQLKRGNLIFNDPLGNKWGIFKNGGYIRKQTPKADRWGMVFRQSNAGSSQIDDDQYMDLAEMISIKYNAENRKQQKQKETLGQKYHKRVDTWNVYKYRDGFRAKTGTCYVPFSNIKKALNIISEEKFKQLDVHQPFDTDKIQDVIVVSGWKYTPLAKTLKITFFNESNSIGYTKVTKQYGEVKTPLKAMNWSKPEVISL